jgi:hypothetical protein
MKDDGENAVSGRNYWAAVSTMKGDDMSTTFDANGEIFFCKM